MLSHVLPKLTSWFGCQPPPLLQNENQNTNHHNSVGTDPIIQHTCTATASSITSKRSLEGEDISSGSEISSPAESSSVMAFLPDFTEHPKPKRRCTCTDGGLPTEIEQSPPEDETTEDDVTFFHDFVAGGVAGCASVVVGHPFDTIKVRMQTSRTSTSLLQTFGAFGGVSSLFRGMGAPLGTAAAVNAIVFSSYGFSSRLYDDYLLQSPSILPLDAVSNHDPWQKSFTCGASAGAVQCFLMCPTEHVKCRLQIQPSSGSAAGGVHYTGPLHAVRHITSTHGIRRLYQGFWSTALREIPAFGVYFASYDYLKDAALTYLGKGGLESSHHHSWIASAWAGGWAGCITWAMVYPVDVIKTRIQTASLTTPWSALRMWCVAQDILQNGGGVRSLFRGLGITLLRAFPVNGTIFPVYEFTLQHVVTAYDTGNSVV